MDSLRFHGISGWSRFGAKMSIFRFRPWHPPTKFLVWLRKLYLANASTYRNDNKLFRDLCIWKKRQIIPSVNQGLVLLHIQASISLKLFSTYLQLKIYFKHNFKSEIMIGTQNSDFNKPVSNNSWTFQIKVWARLPSFYKGNLKNEKRCILLWAFINATK